MLQNRGCQIRRWFQMLQKLSDREEVPDVTEQRLSDREEVPDVTEMRLSDKEEVPDVTEAVR